MKKLLALTVLLGTGCVVQPTATTDVQFQDLLSKDQVYVRDGSGLATAVTLAAIQEDASRVKVGHSAYDIAYVVNKTILSGTVSTDQLRPVIDKLVATADLTSEQRQSVDILLDTVMVSIQQRLNDPAVLKDRRAILARTLILAATDGIMATTMTYASPAPAMQPAAK